MGCEKKNVTLQIYDATGRLVKSFDLTSHISHHTSQIIWDSHDDQNRILPSGVYFLMFTTERVRETRNLLLIR